MRTRIISRCHLTCLVFGYRGRSLVGGSTESTLSLNCLATGQPLRWEVCRCNSGVVDSVWSVFFTSTVFSSTLYSVWAGGIKLWGEARNFWLKLLFLDRKAFTRVSKNNSQLCNFTFLPATMAEDNNVLPDLKDIETKLGLKVPESLIRSLAGGKHQDKQDKSTAAAGTAHLGNCKRYAKNADLTRLESKMLFLKQEMVSIFCSGIVTVTFKENVPVVK